MSDKKRTKAKIQMRHDAPSEMYRGTFTALPGEVIERPFDEAIKLAETLPQVFEPVDFSLEEELAKMMTAQGEEDKDMVVLKLKFNKTFPECYRSVDFYFPKIGSTQRMAYDQAKTLLQTFPDVFEVVTDHHTFQDGEETTDDQTQNLGEGQQLEGQVEEAEDNNSPNVEEAILDFITSDPKTFEEIKSELGEQFTLDELRTKIMHLSNSTKIKKIKENDEEKWMVS